MTAAALTSTGGERRGEGSEPSICRTPTALDGATVHALVARCAPLDPNSLYCNLLQCTHFAATSALAEAADGVAAWVSGYIPPEQPDCLFVWQVAVAPEARGQGLGRKLIREILDRPACRAVNTVITSITPGNDASWRLFKGLARDLEAPMTESLWFAKDRHFAGRHDCEHLVEIGPFGPRPPD